MKKIIKIVSIFLAAAALSIGAFEAGMHFTDIEQYLRDIPEVTETSVEKVIEPSENLVTASYIYKSQEYYEESRSLFDWTLPLTTTSVVFNYEGTVNVGFDMSKLAISNIDKSNRTISLSMPEADILSVEIDPSSYSYEYEKQSMFSDFSMDSITDTMDSLQEKMLKKASADSEFLAEVNERGKKIVESILAESDKTKGYTVIWTDNGGTENVIEYGSI